ncbi:MAG TPA: hypothetical protein VF342_01005 [Alphaproteobacteria bacterium]
MRLFHRLVVAFGVVAFVPACGGAGGRVSEPTITAEFVRAPAGTAESAVQIIATGRQPLTSALLITPSGTTPASLIEREASPPVAYGGGPDVGVGVFGGSGGVGIGTGIFLGIPVGGYDRPVEIVRSRATIPVSDVDAYRQNWPQSVIRITFGTEPSSTTTDVPAPAPGVE